MTSLHWWKPALSSVVPLQVCALQWNKHEREILSSHGFSQNQLCLWKYPSMAKIAEFSVRNISQLPSVQ